MECERKIKDKKSFSFLNLVNCSKLLGKTKKKQKKKKQDEIVSFCHADIIVFPGKLH